MPRADHAPNFRHPGWEKIRPQVLHKARAVAAMEDMESEMETSFNVQLRSRQRQKRPQDADACQKREGCTFNVVIPKMTMNVIIPSTTTTELNGCSGPKAPTENSYSCVQDVRQSRSQSLSRSFLQSLLNPLKKHIVCNLHSEHGRDLFVKEECSGHKSLNEKNYIRCMDGRQTTRQTQRQFSPRRIN